MNRGKLSPDGYRPYAAFEGPPRRHLPSRHQLLHPPPPRRGKSPKTVRTYTEAAQWFAAEHLRRNTDHTDWDQVTANDVRAWTVRLLDTYSDSYANNQYRALQQFFKWWSTDEEQPNPMAKLRPPAVGEKIVPVFTHEELAKLLKHCEGKTFTQRRDFAILSLFQATGLRLSELAGITYDPEDTHRSDLDLMRRELLVTGKGNKQRIVRFGHPSARAIDRYIRIRTKHTHASSRRLWLGTNNRPPMTANGIYQMVVRRGGECGVTVHPHKFRHHFSHTWLDKGGAEGDLMELNGWSSPQMLRRYGKSAASTRARRTYDRIMED
ncbi:tyrosine-type recombinase/integrase [Actinomadura pelletieri]|uniref:tyrosine-type recombinase/integrase n=1 Tax=Actinomadura pelletieri TaxID=111805 RepID=UPI000EB2B0F8|nr:tyrosine-type recombinase/integrase [Actinomadura pelletieri]